jgi:hypothetical protein
MGLFMKLASELSEFAYVVVSGKWKRTLLTVALGGSSIDYFLPPEISKISENLLGKSSAVLKL